MKQPFLTHLLLIGFVSLILFTGCTSSSENKLTISSKPGKGSMVLVQNNQATPIVIDTNDAEVVAIAAEALTNDINSITGLKPKVFNNIPQSSPHVIIAGTLGQSALIDQLA